ncbi:oxidoreductase [Nonlabens ponticola]|uniref:SDR family NAD(P)-dependent oxidoreductase n=1 Tax=Nonlabens ponticola TaxID=2496866 RepID=A0A3S9MW96_9FLAO|nr:oxidoreductase [Nonlabens ponticola]AZQ43495.1 SDR family NAD(P)-dependent oxidoreductase [Nonlabens ponticola]
MEKKIWFITGISSGLGEALATQVMNAGDFVVGTFRKESQTSAFNKKYEDKGHAITLDVTQENEIAPAVKNIIEQFGNIDVLVNNAGIGIIGAVEETSIAETRKVFETNFYSVLNLTNAVLPYMRDRKSGHIIQISSHGGLKAFAGFGIYNASKFALEGFSEALAQEIAPLGIKLTMVEPGPFRTRFASSNLMEADKVIEDYNDTAGAFRNKLKGVDGKQEGDPNKAALAIINLVNSDNPSLRLPLGKTALVTIQMKIDSVQADLDAHREIAAGAIYKS